MKKIARSFVFSAAVVSSLSLGSLPAWAVGSIVFTPSGDSNSGVIKGEVPVASLGSLTIRDGILTLNGKVITLKASSELSASPHVVLAGSIIRCEASARTAGAKDITGMALFLMGEMLTQIDDQNAPDAVFRNNGQLQGRIIGVQGQFLVMRLLDNRQVNVPFSEILFVRSPRVFMFKMNAKGPGTQGPEEPFAGDVSIASMRPTSTARSLSMTSVIPPEQQRKDKDDPLSEPGMTPESLFGNGGVDDNMARPSFPTKRPKFDGVFKNSPWME